MRLCGVRGCGVALLPFAKKWCPEHALHRRTKQLAQAQARYYERLRNGKGPTPKRRQLMRNGEPTHWAKANPALALRVWHARNPEATEAPRSLVEALVTVR